MSAAEIRSPPGVPHPRLLSPRSFPRPVGAHRAGVAQLAPEDRGMGRVHTLREREREREGDTVDR